MPCCGGKELCTAGPLLEERASEVMATGMVREFALDAVGSAAVEALANTACRTLADESAAAGHQTSVPLSSGMIGWSVEGG